MICANCGTENRADRRFCLECGNAFASGCPNCGSENEAKARFCGNCGFALGVPPATEPSPTTPTAAAATERRLVTVLFADLVGFTPFAEERDAEDVRDTLERYSAVARETVARYGGTVEKFIGDAVMAVWGTPTAHEDDAERAVRAALELADAVRTLGPDIQVRAGVLTGEAAVNVGATDQSLLAGDLVNTCSRLQSVAPPGTVLVGESTMRATSAAVAYEPAGEQALKGKSVPIPAWSAMRVIAQRRGAGRSETMETPFVGREEELRLLKDQLHLTGRDPRARLVSVIGPAGIGKSRLAWELEKYTDGVVETIYWHRGRCPSYGEGVTFWALGEMVRGRARLPENADETTTRAQIAEVVDDYVTDESEREWIQNALLTLLGVNDTNASGRELLFAAWRRFFESICARGTTMLVFEDLHWADAGLLDFIDHLLEWSKSVPLLVVTLARPELFDRRPDWGAGRRTFTALTLDALSEAQMREMLSALVPDLPEAALRTIVERADGIPLYAVETVRMLLADGRLSAVDGAYRPTGELGDLEVPESLRSLISSRLDALTPDDRRLMQDASVVGQTFTLAALSAVSGTDVEPLAERLRTLVRRELLTVDADPRSPERGQYAFMQSLVREVAYSTLARSQRRERHLAAARFLESVGGEEWAGALAGHYVAAHLASTRGPEADAVAAQARVALRAAAERAAGLGGHQQAAAFLGQALELTTEPAERAQLLERQTIEHTAAGRYDLAEQAIRAANQLYHELGDEASRARTRGRLGMTLIQQGGVVEAISELEGARADLPADVEPAVLADVLARLARAYYRNLEWQKAMPVADEAMKIAEHNRLLGTLADAMVSKGTALNMASRPQEAIALLRKGMELATREGELDTAFRAAANIGQPVAFEESGTEAGRITYDALETARKVGNLGQIIWHLGNILVGTVLGSGQPLDEVLAEADQVLALDLDRADREHVMINYMVAAAWHGRDVTQLEREVDNPIDPQVGIDFTMMLVSIARGDYARASVEAESVAKHRPHVVTMPIAVLAAAMAGDLDRTRAMLQRSEALPIVGRLGEALRQAERAALAALEGRTNDALPGLREAVRVVREMAWGMYLAVLALLMLRTYGPEFAYARALGEEALALMERIHAWAMVDQLRTALQMPPAAERQENAVQAAEVPA